MLEILTGILIGRAVASHYLTSNDSEDYCDMPLLRATLNREYNPYDPYPNYRNERTSR